MLFATLLQHRIGFYGIPGLLGALIGIVIALIIIWGIYTIFNIIAAKFSNEATGWIFQIVRVILIVLVALWILNVVLGLGWW